MVVGCADGDTEGLVDGAFEAVTVGFDDGTEDVSTHSPLPL